MFRLFLSTEISTFPLAEALPLLPEARREKALRFRHEQGRRECVLAYLLLKQGLKEMYGIDEAPEIIEQEDGKPVMKDHPAIHFNMSHCKEAVACVIGDEPLGVDVERIRTYNPSLARHVLNGEELQAVESSQDPARAFAILWTKKEALLKLTGKGIREDLKEVLCKSDSPKSKVQSPDSTIFTTREYGNFVLTICRYDRAEKCFTRKL